jgi:hypothetical protein
VLEGVVAPVVGYFGGWWEGIVVIAVGMLCIWIGATVRAPIVQRNEARNQLRGQLKPIPLQNRSALIRAISSIRDTAIEVVKQQHRLDEMNSHSPHFVHVDAMTDRDDAYDRFKQSMSELRRECLVAGDAFSSIIEELTGFIWTQVMTKMGQINYGEDIKPVVLRDVLEFTGVLAGRVKEAIRKIDEIRGQVVRKEDSEIE